MADRRAKVGVLVCPLSARMAQHMLPKLTRFALCLFLAAPALTAAGRASAQTGGAPGTSGLNRSDFEVYYEHFDGRNWVQMDETEQRYFFNRARCECDRDTTGFAGAVRIIILSGANTAAKIQSLLTANQFPEGIG
jgi:hypothetical protein